MLVFVNFCTWLLLSFFFFFFFCTANPIPYFSQPWFTGTIEHYMVRECIEIFKINWGTNFCDSLPYLIMKSYTRLLTGLSLVNHLGGYLSLQKRQRNDYLSKFLQSGFSLLLTEIRACVASPTQTMPTKYFFPSHIAHSLKTWMTESLHQQLLPSRSSLLAKCLKSHNQVEQRRRSNLPCSRAVQLTQTPWRWKTAVRFAAISAPPSAASLTGIVRASHKPCTRWKSEKNSTSVGDCTPQWRKTISRGGVRCTRNEMPTVGATSTRRCLKGTY